MHPPSLRNTLMWHVALGVIGCFAVVAVLVAWHVLRLQQAAAVRTADRAAVRIERQLEVERALSLPAGTLADRAEGLETDAGPGECIELRRPQATAGQRYCKGTDADPSAVPVWFLDAWPATARVTRRIGSGDAEDAALVSVETEALQGAAEAWSRLLPLLGLCAATLALLAILLSVLLQRALKPLRGLLQGLDRLADGAPIQALGTQRYREFDRVAARFDRLALALARRTAERDALTLRLVDVQEAERRHIARELHDELGQSLAAVQALAASIGASAEAGSSSQRESRRIEQLVVPMMSSLRSLLLQLRPPGLSEFGLERSLRHLVAEWNGRSRTRFELSTDGYLDDLPDTVSTNVFRVVQECLTNAARHAGASRVSVRLQRSGVEHRLELMVEDDGTDREAPRLAPEGLGLLGMRERITALGGRLDVRTLAPQGRQVSAHLPLPAE